MYDRVEIAGLPAYLVGGGKKAVICFHSFRGSKKAILKIASIIADQGFLVLAPDAVLHGERGQGDVGVMVKENPLLFAKIVKETGDEVPVLVDYLIGRLGSVSVGVIGFSMGGFITYRAVAVEKRLSVAVAVVAGGISEMLRTSQIARDKGRLTLADLEKLENNPLVKEIDLVFLAEKCPPTPLLVLAGGRDNMVTPRSVEAGFNALKKAYEKMRVPDRLKLVFDPNAGHEVSDYMLKEGLSWFRKWL